MLASVRTERFGGLLCRVVGGVDRQGGGEGPVVVLCHGYGAPGDDLVGLHRALDVPRETRFVFPHAPLSLAGPYAMLGMDARAWWPIDIAALEAALAEGRARDLRGEAPAGLVEARAALSGCLDAVEQTLGPAPLVLGGFSQGAMLSLDVALHDPRPLRALALLSGTFLNEAGWRPRLPARAGLRALVSHGTHDALLPFAATAELKDALVEAGWSVDFVPFRGQHEIPPLVLERLSALVRDACG
jgi:phospholipase/carboxylesterase